MTGSRPGAPGRDAHHPGADAPGSVARRPARGTRWYWCPFLCREAPDSVEAGAEDQQLTTRLHADVESRRRVPAYRRAAVAGRPPAAVDDPEWRPVAADTRARAWDWPRVAGARPALVLYAPPAAMHPAVVTALRAAWDVRVFTTVGDLLAFLATQPVPRPAAPAPVLVYAPDGREWAGVDTVPSPGADTGPIAAARETRAGAAHGSRPDPTGRAHAGPRGRTLLVDALRTWPVVVYCAAPYAPRGVPADLAGLPAGPLFDAREVAPPAAAGVPASHLATVRALAVRAGADAVAHRAWWQVVKRVGGEPTASGLGDPPSAPRPEAPTSQTWSPETRAVADALRRLFVRPDYFPDDETLAYAVGLEPRTLERAVLRFGLVPLWSLRQVILVSHATSALWAAQSTPSQTAAALNVPLRRLNLAVRACTGMTPEHVRRWGVAIGPGALLDAVLADRPSAARAREGAGRGVTSAVYLAPDPHRLPEPYAGLPRFVVDVLPNLPGGHPYAPVHPASPYHTGRRPAVASAPAGRPDSGTAGRLRPAALPGSPG